MPAPTRLSHEREQELFSACLALDAAEQAAYLARECGSDRQLQERLRRLLAAHGRAEGATLNPLGQFIEAAAQLAPEGPPTDSTGEGPTARAGDAVGPYRLLRHLAEGGMGSVWLAERSDGMVNRPIALKLPRGPWRRASLAARMAQEREILAALSHPNIARLYDAGLTSDGQPYLALEYVEGRRIDAYCRDKGLGPAARLGLFVQVASAVAHANAKLVVHRDLKPANILVSEDGQVHLLDFGIARLLEDGRARESEVTRVWGRTFTPDYASPEQIAGEPITVASDVYSLGVTLYELLTDVRPYRPKRDTWGALEDAILHDEPVRPSEAAPASRRRALRGDLDTILLKTLKKKPEERYPTANALAEDVERYLQSRPVLARPDTVGYRLRKFVRRNRLAVAAGAAVLVAVLAGAGAAVWQARLARAQERRTAEVKDFLTGILRDTSPYNAASRATTVLDLLQQARANILRNPDASPELRVDVLGIVGTSLLNQQDTDGAETVLTQAVGEGLRELGAQHPETLKARVRMLGVHRFRGRTPQLRRELDELLPLLRADPQGLAESLVVALRNQTHLELDEGRVAEAEAAAAEGLRVAGERLGLRHNETVAASLMLALVALNGKDPALALERSERAYGLTLELFPAEPNHARRIEAQNLHGRALANAGQVARGAEHIAAAVERAGEVFGPSSRMVGVFSRQLARYQLQLGEIERALETSRRSVEIGGQHTEQDSFRYADAQHVHGECLLAAFRPAEAASFLAPAVEVLRARQGPSHPRTVNARAQLALARARAGDLDVARAELEALLRDRRGGLPLHALGIVERLAARPAEALRLQQEWLTSLPPGAAAEPDRMHALAEIGLAEVERGRHAAAAASLDEALALFRKLQTRATPERAAALVGWGRVRLAQGRRAEALPALREAEAVWRAFAPGSPAAAEAARWLRDAQEPR